VASTPGGLKLNETHQLLLCADDVNLLSESMNTIKKNSDEWFVASEEGGLEINNDKSFEMQQS
jgi:hypothetical protein